MTAAEWAIVIAASLMSGICVLALGLAAVQRHAFNRYWGQG